MRTSSRIQGVSSGRLEYPAGAVRGRRAPADKRSVSSALGSMRSCVILSLAGIGLALDPVGDRDAEHERGRAARLLHLRGSAAAVCIRVGVVAEADAQIAADRRLAVPQRGLDTATRFLFFVFVLGFFVVLDLLVVLGRDLVLARPARHGRVLVRALRRAASGGRARVLLVALARTVRRECWASSSWASCLEGLGFFGFGFVDWA